MSMLTLLRVRREKKKQKRMKKIMKWNILTDKVHDSVKEKIPITLKSLMMTAVEFLQAPNAREKLYFPFLTMTQCFCHSHIESFITTYINWKKNLPSVVHLWKVFFFPFIIIFSYLISSCTSTSLANSLVPLFIEFIWRTPPRCWWWWW